jgi:hypothetical protein
MDANDSIDVDVVEALLAVHSALVKLGGAIPHDQFLAYNHDLTTILVACRSLIDKRKSQVGLLGRGIVTGGSGDGR